MDNIVNKILLRERALERRTEATSIGEWNTAATASSYVAFFSRSHNAPTRRYIQSLSIL